MSDFYFMPDSGISGTHLSSWATAGIGIIEERGKHSPGDCFVAGRAQGYAAPQNDGLALRLPLGLRRERLNG